MIGTQARIGIAIAAAALTLGACTSGGNGGSGTSHSTPDVGPASSQTGTSASSQTNASAGGKTKASTGKTKAPTGSQKTSAKPGGPALTHALGDVKLGALSVDAKGGTHSALVTITNHSAKPSNYVVDLSVTSADGKTKLDASIVAVPNLAPGRTATRSAHFTAKQKLPAGAKLTILDVARIVV